MKNRESERRFLVRQDKIDIAVGPYLYIQQGYLFSGGNGWNSRIRLATPSDGDISSSRISKAKKLLLSFKSSEAATLETEPGASLTFKGPKVEGTRPEYNVELSVEDAQAFFDDSEKTVPMIIKNRYFLTHRNNVWSIDVFLGVHAGLVIAECESTPKNLSHLDLPAWLGREVTEDSAYDNDSLAFHGLPSKEV